MTAQQGNHGVADFPWSLPLYFPGKEMYRLSLRLPVPVEIKIEQSLRVPEFLGYHTKGSIWQAQQQWRCYGEYVSQ